MTWALLLTLKLAVSVVIFAIGLGSTLEDLTHLWRRPRLLLRSLVAMYVLVPALAVGMVTVLDLPPAVSAALLVLAVSAGAPLLPRKLSQFGSDAYVFSLVVTSSLLAIVLVPAWVAVLARHFHVDTELQAAVVATAIAKSFLLPLAVGMIVRALFLKDTGEQVADRLIAIGGLAMTAAGIILLVLHWEVLARLGWTSMLTLVALMMAALLVGHVLGGPDPGGRTALAIACATRHVGIAVLVATSFPGPGTAVLIAAYVVAAAVVSIPYLRWRRRVESRAGTGVTVV
jgi:BASS family bile acid:Na+ symporter